MQCALGANSDEGSNWPAAGWTVDCPENEFVAVQRSDFRGQLSSSGTPVLVAGLERAAVALDARAHGPRNPTIGANEFVASQKRDLAYEKGASSARLSVCQIGQFA